MDGHLSVSAAGSEQQQLVVPGQLTAPRLGVVPYLNVLPLLEGLAVDFPEASWLRATPRDLATELEHERVDIAVVSVFEGLRASDRLGLLPGAAIGSHGAVRSVALYSKVPLASIQSVLLDRASLTSIHLARILAAELLHIAPRWEPSPQPIAPGDDWRGAPQDAFVVIGDTALAWEHEFPHKLDLGEGWRELTGLPFVFAAWWVRAGVTLTPGQRGAFAAARARGTANIPAIVDRHLASHPELADQRDSLCHYLGEAVRYTLGPRELAGLAMFREKLISHRLLEK